MFKAEENPYSTWLLESFLICHMCQLTNPSVFAIRNKNPCKEKEAQAIWLQIHFSKDRHSYQALKPLRPCYGWHSTSGVNASGLSLAWIQPHFLLLRAKHEGLRSHYTTTVKSPWALNTLPPIFLLHWFESAYLEIEENCIRWLLFPAKITQKGYITLCHLKNNVYLVEQV